MLEEIIVHKEHNFRDLGGIPVQNGRQVKYGLFYRSAGLYFLSKNERKRFPELGIRYVLDLRTKKECEINKDPVFEGVTMIQHSGLVSKGGEDIDFSIAGMNKTGKDAEEQLEKLIYYYGEMPFHNEAIRIMFEHILEGHLPILIHCATGKDRTGVAAMVLLLALGADDAHVFADYIRSKESREKRLEKVLEKHREEIVGHPELKELLTMKESVSDKIGHMILHEIHTRYPDTKTFLKEEYGLDELKLQKLQEIGTEEVKCQLW